MSGQNQGWANPAPAGLIALGVACFTFFAMQTGQVTSGAVPLLGIWLLGGFAVQVIVGIIELRENNLAGGNTFTYFSAFFMLATGLELIFKFVAGLNGWKLDTHIDGWAWVPLSVGLTLWAPAYLKTPKALFFTVLPVTIATWFITLTDIGAIDHEFVKVSGWLLFVGGWAAIYTSAGVILNGTFGKTILPIGAPFVKPQPAPLAPKTN